MSWLATVAALCQITVSTGSSFTKNSDGYQLQCQKELIICYRNSVDPSRADDQLLADCVLKRAKDNE